MKIIEAKYNGFCFGVQQAIDTVERALEQTQTVYTLGPIIHNDAVVRALQIRGAHPIDSIDEIESGATLVIRSHGAAPQVIEACLRKGIRVINATCPFVRHIQKQVMEYDAKGYPILIAGKAAHPEVIGINGCCNRTAIILASAEQAKERITKMDRAFLVAQTTFRPEEFEEIAKVLKDRIADLVIENTICKATCEKQKEARELAKKCDAMIVIGGKHSSNTNQLYQICKDVCPDTKIVENADEVDIEKPLIHDIIGVVAGASTPQWSIREVIARMSEMEQNAVNAAAEAAEQEQVQPAAQEETTKTTQAEEPQAEATEQPANQEEEELTPEESFERDLEKTMVRIRNGQVKKGTVVSIVGDDVFVNIGYKADGIIPQSELSLDPKAVASDILSVGDEVTVEILKVNDGEGNVLLSKKKVDQRQQDRQAVADLEDGRHFDVRVKQAVKGGLLGEYHGARVFIPASQVAEKFVENLDEFAGKTLTVKAIEVDKSKKRVVASRRQVLKEEAIAKRKEKYNQFEAGQVVKGVVRRITDFGAFTDIGGIDGLIHVTDLSWGRVKHPSDIVKVGDEIEVEILSVNPETERIALGYKQLQPKPWDHAAERYLVGDIVEGTVDRIAPFGAFVELEPGLFGLVHISQVATRRIEKVEDELMVGDVITVKVLEVDPEKKRISLSRRAVLQENMPHRPVYQEEEESYDDYELPPVEQATVSLADFFPKEEDAE